jgi:hypothetical protein
MKKNLYLKKTTTHTKKSWTTFNWGAGGGMEVWQKIKIIIFANTLKNTPAFHKECLG